MNSPLSAKFQNRRGKCNGVNSITSFTWHGGTRVCELFHISTEILADRGQGGPEVGGRLARPRNGCIGKSRASSADNATDYFAPTSFVVAFAAAYLGSFWTSLLDRVRQSVSPSREHKTLSTLGLLSAALDPDKAFVIPASSVRNTSAVLQRTGRRRRRHHH